MSMHVIVKWYQKRYWQSLISQQLVFYQIFSLMVFIDNYEHLLFPHCKEKANFATKPELVLLWLFNITMRIKHSTLKYDLVTDVSFLFSDEKMQSHSNSYDHEIL